MGYEQDLFDLLKNSNILKVPPKNLYLRHHMHRLDAPGYALLECASAGDAQSILDHLNFSKLRENTLWIQFDNLDIVDRKVHLSLKTKKLMLHGVHYSTTKNELYELVGQWGKVMNVKIEEHQSFATGRAVITMRTEQE